MQWPVGKLSEIWLEHINEISLFELGACYTLGLIETLDYEAIAISWLENGFVGEEISLLAFGTPKVSSVFEGDIEKAFVERGLSSFPTQEQAIWLLFRLCLRRMVEHPNDYLKFLGQIVELCNLDDKILLFERPDCRAYFAEQSEKHPNYQSRKYAAEEYGAEHLYGLYFSDDDYSVWTEKLEAKRKSAVIENAEDTLERFYSGSSDLPDFLIDVKKMI